jgi:hypothetical protein
MKINFKHATVFLVLIAIAATSCSSNSDSEPEPLPDFFNLNVGNEWVYKKYQNSYENLEDYTFTGEIDSVKVVAKVTIDGIEFSKIQHKIRTITGGGIMNPRYEYLRVDELGHLIGTLHGAFFYEDPTTANGSNYIRHPGDDITYQNTLVQESGTIFTSVFPNTNIIVEGNNYTVSPLVLEYTSPEGTVPMINKSIASNYQRQIGLIKKTNAYVSGNLFWEDRLVSYLIVN